MRRRRGSAIIPILLVLIILGAVAIATVKVYNKLNIFGNWLTEEFVPENVVIRGVFSVGYGKVYEVTATKEGWKLQEANKAIYEKIVLKNVDLSQNDAVTPHLWDWYFDGQDDYIELPYSAISSTYSYTVVTRFYTYSSNESAEALFSFNVNGEKMTVNLIHFTVVGTIYDGSKDHPVISSNTFALGTWHVMAHVVNYDSATNMTSHYVYLDGTVSDTDTFTGHVRTSDIKVGGSIGSLWKQFSFFYGYISYFAYYDVAVSTSVLCNLGNCLVDKNNLLVFLDPTITNGTHYIDLTGNGYHGIPRNGVHRVPAKSTWLWLVKQLASDNKVHFMYFPQGSIIRIKDSSGNVIRQFVIDEGTIINDGGQIEDYAIDIPSASISQATVEAWVPSMKIRVYGPPSAKVEVVKNNVIYGSGIVGASGYVDIQLSQKLGNAEIWICAEKSDKELKLDIKEDGDNLVVAVLDENNILVPNALVMVKDATGVVIAYATTDDSGQVIFSKSELLSGLFSKELTFTAKAIWNSKYYESKEVSYTLVSEHVGTEIGEHLAENKERYILYGLGLLALILFVMILARARRR